MTEEKLAIEYTDPQTGEVVERLDRLIRPKLNSYGQEIPNPVPIEPPLGYKKSVPIRDQIRAMVLSEQLALEAERAGAETFEEADDFVTDDDDYDPHSPWEDPLDNDWNPPSAEMLEAAVKKLGWEIKKPETGNSPDDNLKAKPVAEGDTPPASGEAAPALPK